MSVGIILWQRCIFLALETIEVPFNITMKTHHMYTHTELLLCLHFFKIPVLTFCTLSRWDRLKVHFTGVCEILASPYFSTVLLWKWTQMFSQFQYTLRSHLCSCNFSQIWVTNQVIMLDFSPCSNFEFVCCVIYINNPKRKNKRLRLMKKSRSIRVLYVLWLLLNLRCNLKAKTKLTVFPPV